MDFAERLSLWFNAFDAIHLQALHQGIRGIQSAAPAPARHARTARTANLDEDFRQVRGVLAKTINDGPLAQDDASTWTAWQRRHQELQRQMEQMVGALREHAREVLAQKSARLRQLATLDAALEQLLVRREQSLLPRVAALLQQRFKQLRSEAAEGWQETFGREWRQALLAELDLRLEPVAGLIDALRNEWNNPR
jgi:Protein of unknown function (DUF3348)